MFSLRAVKLRLNMAAVPILIGKLSTITVLIISWVDSYTKKIYFNEVKFFIKKKIPMILVPNILQLF